MDALKDMPGWEGLYAITLDGRVWSYRSDRFMAQIKSKTCKYLSVILSKDRKDFNKLIHCLMAETFLGKTSEQSVDHINRIKTDNRLENLRLCTVTENLFNRPAPCYNTSGFKGVSKTQSGKWRVQLRMYNHTFNLGSYADRGYAAIIYHIAAKLAHGEFYCYAR